MTIALGVTIIQTRRAVRSVALVAAVAGLVAASGLLLAQPAGDPAQPTPQPRQGPGGPERGERGERGAARAEAAEARVTAIGEQLEADRTSVAEGVTAALKTIGGFAWLISGRGSYEWDDDRWHKEFESAATGVTKALEPLQRLPLPASPHAE